MSVAEEAALVAFKETLSDGYQPDKAKKRGEEGARRKNARLHVMGPNPFNPTTQLRARCTEMQYSLPS